MKYIDIKKEGHICWVYLDREESMNALSTDVLKELTEVNLSLNEDLESRVVIYSGKGDHFSAGADLKEKQKHKKINKKKQHDLEKLKAADQWDFSWEGCFF
ncbi:MAG TPA: enoyl-CoA hydratase/isomerase family protein, partial [SAR86 cluster bacterium]|nr:enoyl-CoA hydratase/isomerase family protein [SAR86 cluster bacterium]